MDPVEECVQLKQQITQLQARADQLRHGFSQPGARLRSNQTEIVLRLQARRVFVKDRLPAEILHNPVYWEQRRSMIATVRPLDDTGRDPTGAEQDVQLTEPFDSFAPPRFAATHPGPTPG